MPILTIESMQKKILQIKSVLDAYKGNIEAPLSIETRRSLREAINAQTIEEFQKAVSNIQPHQLGILDVHYGITLYD